MYGCMNTKKGVPMNRLEQRCRGVAKIFDDYNIKYKKKYNNPKYLHFIYKGRGWE